jgi:hypothetical protein
MVTDPKKAMLAILIFPAGLFWCGICFFGVMFFSHGMFADLSLFLFSLLPIIGLFCLVVAYFSVIRFPKVSGFSAITVLIGFVALGIGIYIGFFTEIWFILTALSLFLGGLMLLVEYVRGT